VTGKSATGTSASTRLIVGKLAPSVVAVPTTAAPGTPVTVKGFGFAAGEGVTLSFAGQKVGSVSTNGSGQFSATFTVPGGTASGSYPVAASSASGRRAGITLRVTRSISTHYYFASLYTGSGYHEYLAFLNPTETRAQVSIQYQKTTGQTVSKSITINPHTRMTEDVNADVGVHVSAGAAVAADVPIVAERVVYHGSDGSVVPGVSAPSKVWYFANGNTSHHYREYVAVQNPNSQPIQIQVHFLPTHHAQFTITRTMPATSRTTIKVSTYVPKDAVGVIVTSSAPIVANRSIFIRHGMTSKIGVAAPGHHWYFAAGPGNNAARNWIGAINPFNRWSYLTLHAYNGSGQEVGTIKQWLRPFARVGYLMNKQAHAANVAVAISASAGIIAEQTTYAGGMHDASTDTLGIPTPAKSFAFAFANTGGGQGDRLSLFNPNLTSIPVVVQFMTSGGQVSSRTYVVSPLAHLAVDVGSVAPNAQLGLVAASNDPFVALNRAWYGNGSGAMTSTGISG
jgi:hypothetical protein